MGCTVAYAVWLMLLTAKKIISTNININTSKQHADLYFVYMQRYVANVALEQKN